MPQSSLAVKSDAFRIVLAFRGVIGGHGELPLLAFRADGWFFLRVPLPYKIATLLYCFNEQGEVLLMERAREPNKGLWSPCGGKLDTDSGESPHACACREAREELGLVLRPKDLHLLGIVSETGYEGAAHWLMFLFEVKVLLRELPAAHPEGRFAFFSRTELARLKLPATDVEKIWPLVWEHRNGFFAAHCDARPEQNFWTLEESRLAAIS